MEKKPVASHTPGPWKVTDQTKKDVMRWIEANSNGDVIAILDAGQDAGISEDTATRLEANAALIAAAPDLLEAVDSLLVYAEAEKSLMEENGDDISGITIIINQANNAMNNAEGK